MKRSALIFTLVIAICHVQAQIEDYKSGSLLWKISGKDLSKPSYLLGTFHLKPGEYLDSIPGAKTALESCEQIVCEIAISDMAGVKMQMMQAMIMTSDTTYKMLYSEEDYRFVDEQLTLLTGFGLEQLNKIKPAAIQLSIIALAYEKYFPTIDTENTLDVHIQSEAAKEQKPVLGLETVDEQIHAIFGIMDLQRQADVLLCNLKNMDELFTMVPEIIHDYDLGNLNNLYEDNEDTGVCPSTPEEVDALNKDRNIAWMAKLSEIMKEKSSFIAVGALHLAGEDGLLNLLEKAGYNVEMEN